MGSEGGNEGCGPLSGPPSGPHTFVPKLGPGGRSEARAVRPHPSPAGLSARPRPGHPSAPSASSWRPPKPVHVLTPLGKATWGKGRSEGSSSSWSPNPVPLRGHGHLFFRLTPASHAAGLPKRSSLPSGAGRDRAGRRARAGRRRGRLQPLSRRQRRPVRPGAGCELRPWPQPRGEEARTGNQRGIFVLLLQIRRVLGELRRAAGRWGGGCAVPTRLAGPGGESWGGGPSGAGVGGYTWGRALRFPAEGLLFSDFEGHPAPLLHPRCATPTISRFPQGQRPAQGKG